MTLRSQAAREKLAHMRQLLAQFDSLGDLSRDRLEQDAVVRAAADLARAPAPEQYAEYVRQVADFVPRELSDAE